MLAHFLSEANAEKCSVGGFASTRSEAQGRKHKVRRAVELIRRCIKDLLIRSYACQNLGLFRKHCQKHIFSSGSEFQKAKF
jgi:hypothetical protein